MAERPIKEWVQAVADAPAVFQKSVRIQMIEASLVAEAEAKKNATTKLHVRTGRLRSSIRGYVRKNEIVLQAGQTGRVKYAAIHEFGGVIVPKRGRFLAIPLNRTAAGVARGGSGGAIRLVERVRIPKRPYLRPAINKARKHLQPALRKAVTVAVLP